MAVISLSKRVMLSLRKSWGEILHLVMSFQNSLNQ